MNKARALRRLRERIALDLREPVELAASFEPPAELVRMVQPGAPGPGARRRHTAPYLAGAAALLDLFAQAEASLSETARVLKVPKAAVARVIRRDERLARKVGEMRSARGRRSIT